MGGGNPSSKQGQVWTEVPGPVAGKCHSRIWINLVIRTDQEPALKQIARTWQSSRAAMKLKSHIQLVAVGQHQGLLSERYIQTVRRQTSCLMHELEARTGVTVRLGPAGWLLNRFQPASGQGGQTPFELGFERRYVGKLVPFGTTVFARTPPGKPKGIAKVRHQIHSWWVPFLAHVWLKLCAECHTIPSRKFDEGRRGTVEFPTRIGWTES